RGAVQARPLHLATAAGYRAVRLAASAAPGWLDNGRCVMRGCAFRYVTFLARHAHHVRRPCHIAVTICTF
ncbi:hypothetical protein, partial [Diaphorobacter sp.]|uniref:hypothetical protein n=1 Tax=Diaphorobacter sp. TaxID=1934310 RepID=UPI00289E7436